MKISTFTVLLSSCTGALAATASQYAQCGGKGFTRPTTCASGLKCYCQSAYYSQCLQTDPGWTGCGASTGDAGTDFGADSYSPPPIASTGTTKSKTPAKLAPTTPKASSSSSGASINYGSCAAYTGSKSGYATTTHYYDGQVGACGCSTGGAMSSWQANPGTKVFTAAGSQTLFGGSGSWCGSGCGKCYQLTNVGSIAASGQGGCTGAGDTITVMVTNLCPANGNEQWCSQPSNQFGYGAHFDIMSKDGPLGWNNPVVRYKEVTCPGSLNSDYATCQCAKGATSRVRRGLIGS